MPDTPKIFISHSHADWRLAEHLQAMLERISGNGFDLSRSSEKGAIRSGENWRAWIDDKVLRCDVAIVLLTPSSFRGQWVLWEAGAVTGVQYERQKEQALASSDPLARRIRVVRFNVDGVDLGPFGSSQVRNGLDLEEMISLAAELLEEFSGCLDKAAYRRAMVSLRDTITTFIAQATDDLRYSPIAAEEGIVQEWLMRLDNARANDNDRWIIAAKRWINVAFLGANNADAHLSGEVIDFRIHTRIAEAHRRLGDWDGAAEQLRLAAKLSPNDLVILRDLAGVLRQMGKLRELEALMEVMQRLDEDIFKKDREGIAVRCGYFSKMQNWPAVDRLLGDADPTVVSVDPYLANWHAIATMKVHGPKESTPMFRTLKDLLRQPDGFWDIATLINALLALNEASEAADRLHTLNLPNRSRDEVESAPRFYDEIVSTFGYAFDWRSAAGFPGSRHVATT